MTKEDALQFLRQHQPMPPDSELSQELIKKYDEVCRFFMKHHYSECIPLLLNSFGEGSGFGRYERVGQVIRNFSADQVVPHLIEALSSGNRYVRDWCAQLSIDFPVPELLAPLKLLLREDSDIRFNAVTALEQYHSQEAKAILREHLPREHEHEIRELIQTVLDSK